MLCKDQLFWRMDKKMDIKEQWQELLKDHLEGMQKLSVITKRKLKEKYGEEFTVQKYRINESNNTLTWLVTPGQKTDLLFSAIMSGEGELTDNYVSRKHMYELETEISYVLEKANIRTLVRALPVSEEGNKEELYLMPYDYIAIHQIKWIHLAIVADTDEKPVEDLVPVLKALFEPLKADITVDLCGCSPENFEQYRDMYAKCLNISATMLEKYGVKSRFRGYIAKQTVQEEI